MSFLLFSFLQNCHSARTSSMVIAAPRARKADQFRRATELKPNSDNINAKTVQRASGKVVYLAGSSPS
jgi:hypothetical protein